MRIAVDVGALASPGDGIGRYLASLLASAMAQSDAASEWLLYGRKPVGAAADTRGRVRQRNDHLPRTLGRVAALCSSLPVWAAIDQPDVFWGPAHRLPCHLPRRTARVVTIHDLCWLKAPETMRPITRLLDARLMPRALAQADRIIAVSSATAADLRDAFPGCAQRIAVVHAAAAAMPPAQSRESLLALGITAPYVLYVGTLEPRKNLRRLIHAFDRATDAGSATQLIIAGAPGWGEDRIEDQLSGLDSAARIRVLGRVEDAVLATLYRHALFLALPSLYEGFGLPLLEAMAQGTPVLTSQRSSMPEVAGDAGLLVDPLDVDSMAAGMRRLLSDSTLRARLSERAVAQAARFSWIRAAQETLSVFEDARRERCARMGR